MAAPAVYTESAFADYLATQIDQVAAVLDWDAGAPQVVEAVNDALLDLGATSIAAVSDIRALRALGRRAIWRAVANATAGNYAFTDVAQQQFSRQQVHDHAVTMLNLAEADCQALGIAVDGVAFGASILHVNRPHDPYAVLPDTERVRSA